MKIFISQPMKGQTDSEIKAERDKIIQSVKASKGIFGDDVEILDSFFEVAPHDAKPVWFLAKSLEKLSGADLVLFAPGWETARGCRIEKLVCKEYGIKTLEVT